MGQAVFFSGDARKRAAAAVKAVEAQTSAEIVVAARRVSGEYRAADYHVGFIATGLIVAWMLVAPQVFSLGEMALEGVAAFVVGALLSAHVPPLRRLLIRGKRLSANVERAARAVFYDLGTSRTTGRNGILVFVSAFERRCAVVPDIGVDPDALGEAYRAACNDIRAAVRRLDLEAFATALETLGPALAKAMPHQQDDVNELPDEVQ